MNTREEVSANENQIETTKKAEQPCAGDITTMEIASAQPLEVSEAETWEVGVFYHKAKWWNVSKAEAAMKELNVPFAKCTKQKSKAFFNLIFNSLEEKEEGVRILNSQAKGDNNKAQFRCKDIVGEKKAKAQRKRRQDEQWKERRETKKQKAEEEKAENTEKKPVPTCIEDVVTPLWRLPYEEQLKQKEYDISQIMVRWSRTIRKNHPEIKFTGNRGELCPRDPIVPSPVQTSYRNKSVYAIGINQQGEKEVGFSFGKYDNNTGTVEGVQNVSNIRAVDKTVVLVMREFVRAHSQWDVYHKLTHTGVFRQIQVRSTEPEQGHIMLTVQVNDTGLEEQGMGELKSKLVSHFASHCGQAFTHTTGYSLVSLQLQRYSGISNSAPYDCLVQVLSGSPYMDQQLCGLKFRISSNSFFQVNTHAAAVLYSIIGEWAGAKLPGAKKQVVFDVCCGAGTIGLTVAKDVAQVVGLEVVGSAISDAEHNAVTNGIKNVKFVCGKAEDLLRSELTQADQGVDITAIVDPPRAGLHHLTATAIRFCPQIKRVVYVACDPKQIVNNLQRLMQPRKKHCKGEPFRAVKAVPVDLFPGTPHCELVVLLERGGSEEGEREKESSPAAAVESPSVTPVFVTNTADGNPTPAREPGNEAAEMKEQS